MEIKRLAIQQIKKLANEAYTLSCCLEEKDIPKKYEYGSNINRINAAFSEIARWADALAEIEGIKK